MEVDKYKNLRGISKSLTKAWSNAKPPAKLTPSEWAELHCRIPLGNAVPGQVRFRNAPYQREILDIADEPNTRRISLMFGAQTGKTQAMLMLNAFFIAHKPQSQMMMQPSQSDLQTWLHGKFNPLVDSTPMLSESIAAPRARDGVNNQLMKSFLGGNLMFAWSGSPKTMRGRSAPKIFCDEIDGYTKTEEGDPVNLLWQRAATFGDQRLLIESSTPTIKGASAIETSFEAGDKRRWYCPCPTCGDYQHLQWKQVQWTQDEDGEHDPTTAFYECEFCGEKWDDLMRRQAIKRGEWRGEKPFKGHASYHLPEMCSLFRKLGDIVQSFLEKKDAHDLQTFVNVSLAETWEEDGDTVEPHTLMARAEHYEAEVPDDVVILTGAVDVQKDRLELGVEGWAHGFENWKIDFKILYGDPNKDQVWQDLDEAISKVYTNRDGVKFKLASVFVDSGYLTSRVYQFTRPRQPRRVFAIKGIAGSGKPIIGRASKSSVEKALIYPLGVDTCKDVVMGRLQVKKVGPSYTHFPSNKPVFDAEYYEQLTAEHAVTEYVKGYAKRVWKAKRKRNEAFDIACYNMACITNLNPNFKSLAESLKPEEPEPEEETVEEPEAVIPQRQTAKRKIKLRPRKRSFLV